MKWLASDPRASLDDVLITAELHRRAARPHDFEAENGALSALARTLSEDPQGILQALVDMALVLCRADSAGISLLEPGEDGGAFRWSATAGCFTSKRGGTIPRVVSPCGVVLERDAVLLFDRPGRYFGEFAGVDLPTYEKLFVPFHFAGQPIGALWVAAHTPQRNFDAEDARLLQSLSEFAAAGYQVQTRARQLEAAHEALADRIAEHQQAEAALVHANERLAEADRRKDEFLATLAHELRNPLAPIQSGLDVLRLSAREPELADRVLTMMERQMVHLGRLVDDLLDVSRISQGKVTLRTEPADLSAIIRAAVETNASGSPTRRIRVQLPSEPLIVGGDPVRLAQIVSNLLGNAVKYTDEGGRIWITGQLQDGWVVLSVRDDGIGIAPEMLDRVFGLFTQVDRRAEGLGIGLTLVRRLVELHGGAIEARSGGPGRGSEFIVHLPLTTCERSPQATPDQDRRGLFAGRRILVVDDHPDVAESLALLLQALGAEATAANDGPTALEKTSELAPDIVFLDIGMPNMDGYEVARTIRAGERGADIVLVAVTGWGQENDRLRAEQAGFDRHLVKPVTRAALEAVVAG